MQYNNLYNTKENSAKVHTHNYHTYTYTIQNEKIKSVSPCSFGCYYKHELLLLESWSLITWPIESMYATCTPIISACSYSIYS